MKHAKTKLQLSAAAENLAINHIVMAPTEKLVLKDNSQTTFQ
jgi:hypothetical protein